MARQNLQKKNGPQKSCDPPQKKVTYFHMSILGWLLESKKAYPLCLSTSSNHRSRLHTMGFRLNTHCGRFRPLGRPCVHARLLHLLGRPEPCAEAPKPWPEVEPGRVGAWKEGPGNRTNMFYIWLWVVAPRRPFHHQGRLTETRSLTFCAFQERRPEPLPQCRSQQGKSETK